MKLKFACETPIECFVNNVNKHKAGCPAGSAMAKIVAGWVGAGLPLDEIVNRFDEISVLEYASRILEATGESQ